MLRSNPAPEAAPPLEALESSAGSEAEGAQLDGCPFSSAC